MNLNLSSLRLPFILILISLCVFSGCAGQKRYKIVDREISDPHRIRLRVSVPYGTSSNDMIEILREIADKYKQYGDAMEIWLWETELTDDMKRVLQKKMIKESKELGVPVYPDYEPWLFESRSVYRVTWLYPDEWSVEEHSGSFNLDDSALSRFNEKDRMKIYREVLASEQEVTQRAVSLYGRNLSVMLETNNARSTRNRQLILDKYGLSHAEWSQILQEGIQKWWG